MKPLPVLLLLSCFPAAAEPIAGAWERFPTQVNASAWKIYDYSNATSWNPLWASGDANPFIYRFMGVNPNNGISGLLFYAGPEVASGALVGDFRSKKIRGLRLRYFVDPADLGRLECTIRGNGPAGLKAYYSEPVQGTSLQGSAQWRQVEFSFWRPWYHIQGANYVPVAVTPGLLGSVEEVGFRFMPPAGRTPTNIAAIDDVVLIPGSQPIVTTGLSGNNFTISFTPVPGLSCSLEKSQTGNLANWQPVAGQQGITGTTAHVFQTPRTAAKAFYRLQVDEVLTPLVTPP